VVCMGVVCVWVCGVNKQQNNETTKQLNNETTKQQNEHKAGGFAYFVLSLMNTSCLEEVAQRTTIVLVSINIGGG
jgi:hypothetical protein